MTNPFLLQRITHSSYTNIQKIHKQWNIIKFSNDYATGCISQTEIFAIQIQILMIS